jgi:hypothetical protein
MFHSEFHYLALLFSELLECLVWESELKFQFTVMVKGELRKRRQTSALSNLHTVTWANLEAVLGEQSSPSLLLQSPTAEKVAV